MSSVSSVLSLKLMNDLELNSLASDCVDDDFMDDIIFGLFISCAQFDEEDISDDVVLSVRPRPTHLRILVRNELAPPEAVFSIDGLSTLLLARLFGSNCIVTVSSSVLWSTLYLYIFLIVV